VVQKRLLAPRQISSIASRHAPLSDASAPICTAQPSCLCGRDFTLAKLPVNSLVLNCETMVDLLTARVMGIPWSISASR